MTDPIRLSKRLIELVGCSRREAELFIEWLGYCGRRGHRRAALQGQHPENRAQPGCQGRLPEPVTIILHKPASASAEDALQMITPGTLSVEHSYSKRPLKGHFMRLEAISSLQANASGLMVFSQDWKILRKLTDDRSKIEQEYVVEISGEMVAHGLNRLNHGLTYKGKELPAVKASWQNENRLRFAMKNPQPGIIALLCEAVGLKIVAIRRIRIGGVSMGKLPEGQWRYMTTKEKF